MPTGPPEAQFLSRRVRGPIDVKNATEVEGARPMSVLALEGKVMVGQLVCRATDSDAALARLQRDAGAMRPSVRRGSNAQWFAVLVDNSGFTVATSESLPSEEAAQEAADSALRLLRSSASLLTP